MANDLQTNLDIIDDFTQRLQVAVIGAEETTAKHEHWVEGTSSEVIQTINGPIKTLRGLIADWDALFQASFDSTVESYDSQFAEKLVEYDNDFLNYLLNIGFEPAEIYQGGITIERRSQTVAYDGVTHYWAGTLPFTTTGVFVNEADWLIAPIVGGIEIPQITFATGGNLVRKTQSVLGTDGEWYFWTGSFPKTIPVASTLESAGGVGLNKFKLASGHVPVRPMMKILSTAAGFVLNAGSFEYGATITSSSQVLPELNTGRIWKWDGPIPKVVDLNSSPASSGGVGENLWSEVVTATGSSGSGITIGATKPTGVGSGHRWFCTTDGRTYVYFADGDSVQWVEESPQNSVFDGLEPRVRESLRRSYAEAGYNLVDGSFEVGGALVNPNDVLLYEASGKAFSGPAGFVDAGTDPTSGGFVDVSFDGIREQLASDAGADLVGFKRSNIADAVHQGLAKILNLQPVTPETFGANDSDTDDTLALANMFAFAKLVPCEIKFNRRYTSTNSIACYYADTHNQAIKIVGAHAQCGITFTGASGDALFDVYGNNMQVDGITIEDNLPEAQRYTKIAQRYCGENGNVQNIKSRGYFMRGVLFVAFNRSSVSNIEVYSANTDVANLRGVGLQFVSCVNTSVFGRSYVYRTNDGLVLAYRDGETFDSLKPSTRPTVTYNNEGLEVTGVKTVISNHSLTLHGIAVHVTGCVFDLSFRKMLRIGGLRNKVTGNWFGNDPAVPANQEMFSTWIDTPNGGLISGNTFASIGSDRTLTVTGMRRSWFTNNTLVNISCTVDCALDMTVTGNMPQIFATGSTPEVVITNQSQYTTFMPTLGRNRFSRPVEIGALAPSTSAKLCSRAESGERIFQGVVASGSVIGTCEGGVSATPASISNAAVLFVGSMTSTGRSLNATGTINASGSDYAEYMKKSPSCGLINKGDIAGIDSNAELTDRYDDAIAFCIKSTDPSMVGGDSMYEAPYPSLVDFCGEDEDVDKLSPEFQRYKQAVEEWELKYESVRVTYDRIAFCGQVPCNVSDAAVGDYIVPMRLADGSIGGQAVKSPTFEQYQCAVGKVWKIMEDGRAWVAVKIS